MLLLCKALHNFGLKKYKTLLQTSLAEDTNTNWQVKH